MTSCCIAIDGSFSTPFGGCVALEFVLSLVLALQAVSSSQAEPLYCDFAFVIGDECILLHRALLAARSKYFKHMLTSQWQPKVTPTRI